MFRTTHCLCQPAIYRRYSRYGILHNANLLFCASFRQADDFHGAAQTVFHIFFRPKLCHDDFHSVCSLWNPAFWLLVRQAIPWKPAYPGGKLLQASISSWNYLPCPRITASLLRPDEFLRLLISTMDGLLCGTDG